jgi:hypothetical protein
MTLLRLFVASLLLSTAASAAVPASINNDDSCDIKVGPAATLLLPYFEVDVSGTSGQTTLFTITNVSRYPEIAHVTLWTDWAFPVLTFNLFLTGYDVQAINLADVLVNRVIAPPNGTTSAAAQGTLSTATNPNLRATSGGGASPGLVPASIMTAVREALTIGVFHPPGTSSCRPIGGTHANAIGYATIDVVASCSDRMPLDATYYTADLLFDNVLIGDYQQIGANPAGTNVRRTFDAAGNPMVHIRAIPEGGGAGSIVATALPYTFYDRYTPSAMRTIDRRQPLPSTFAARYIQGGRSLFETNQTIWREGTTGPGASCDSYHDNEPLNIGEIIRFDEHENPTTLGTCFIEACSPPTLPATSSSNTRDSQYPFLLGTDVGGWLYMNLNNGGSAKYSVTRDLGGVSAPTSERTALAPAGSTTIAGPRPSQNWVTTSLFGTVAGNHLTAELDAAPLGNGCTPASFLSVRWIDTAPPGAPPIGPAGGLFVCPPGTTLTNGTTTLCTGTNGNPKP